jgi:hypothetical protein
MSDEKIEIQNKETLLGPDENADGTPIQVVTKDGETTHEIHNKETLLGPNENADGTPVKVVTTTA